MSIMAATDDMDDDLVDVMAVDDDEPQARSTFVHPRCTLGLGLIATVLVDIRRPADFQRAHCSCTYHPLLSTCCAPVKGEGMTPRFATGGGEARQATSFRACRGFSERDKLVCA